MAMIKCPECGKDISDLASSCPHCGFPIGFESSTTSSGQSNNQYQQISNPYQNEIPTNTYAEKQKNDNNGKNSTLGILALVFSILGCTFWLGLILGIIDLCKKDGKKKSCSIVALCICGFWLIIGIIGSSGKDSTEQTITNQANVETTQETDSKEESVTLKENDVEPIEEYDEPEMKDKYYVGDIYENKTLKMTYITCYEFTDYDQYNAPSTGNKIICAEFEFENIGNSDTTVMYTDFHGYADGYEVSQSYAPDGTGIDFTVKMSVGRKGTGKVAFEVPENAQEIEIEFSPNFWISENIIFVYE